MTAGRHSAGGLELSTEFSFEISFAAPFWFVSSAVAIREGDITKHATTNRATNRFILTGSPISFSGTFCMSTRFASARVSLPYHLWNNFFAPVSERGADPRFLEWSD